jgi:histone H3/H4
MQAAETEIRALIRARIMEDKTATSKSVIKALLEDKTTFEYDAKSLGITTNQYKKVLDKILDIDLFDYKELAKQALMTPAEYIKNILKVQNRKMFIEMANKRGFTDPSIFKQHLLAELRYLGEPKGKPKGNPTKHDSKKHKKRHDRSSMAGLIFPVGRIESSIRHIKGTNKLTSNVGPYITGAMQALADELIRRSFEHTNNAGRVRIQKRDIQKALEFNPLLATSIRS